MINFCKKSIVWSFYFIFFLVPLIFFGDTSELFEFNKMWLTFALTLCIGFFWIAKMIAEKQFQIRRTMLDIPLLLFLLSQIISTIFSLDRYVSFWGYYSRFNGGLLSTITYIFLYYAFVTNIEKKYISKMLGASLLSGFFVSLWGLPAHFGYDPTCFIFRGTFDVSCWTEAFQPEVRIFSTLGQPDWMAAYLILLIPIAIAFGINALQKKEHQQIFSIKQWIKISSYFFLTILFYLDFLYTASKSGFFGLWAALTFLVIGYFWIYKKHLASKKTSLQFAALMFIAFAIITFFAGSPFDQLNKLTWQNLKTHFTSSTQQSISKSAPAKPPVTPIGELGGTDSGKIRLIVWHGTIDAWMHNPIFGTGVETFAFAYYKYRLASHNLTSEWDYLYNKAHNEFLNYMATTGIFGLGTYLAISIVFFIFAIKMFPQQSEIQKGGNIHATQLLILSLFASYVSILVTNFFGFSVVIINIFFFLIPAFVLLIETPEIHMHATSAPRSYIQKKEASVNWQWLGITICLLFICYFLFLLYRYWAADKAYALGYNLDHAGQPQLAYSYLHTAVEQRPSEPTFQDELAINDATLAVTIAQQQKDATGAGKFAVEAIQVSQNLVANHPNNVVFWKNQVRIFYSLAQLNQRYLPYALSAIQKAAQLAPTDAKISYNLGLLYGQTGNTQKAVETLQNTVQLKPDYRDAYYALGLFAHQAAVDAKGNVIHPQLQQQAIAAMQYILQHLFPQDQQAHDALKAWNAL